MVLHEDRDGTDAAKAPPSSSTQAPTRIQLPVVLIGTDCATLGAAGLSENGATAYCAHLAATDDNIWSLYQGDVASPTLTPGPDEQVYPSQTELPVQVCMQQTNQSRADCFDDVSKNDQDPPAGETPTPTTESP